MQTLPLLRTDVFKAVGERKMSRFAALLSSNHTSYNTEIITSPDKSGAMDGFRLPRGCCSSWRLFYTPTTWCEEKAQARSG